VKHARQMAVFRSFDFYFDLQGSNLLHHRFSGENLDNLDNLKRYTFQRQTCLTQSCQLVLVAKAREFIIRRQSLFDGYYDSCPLNHISVAYFTLK